MGLRSGLVEFDLQSSHVVTSILIVLAFTTVAVLLPSRKYDSLPGPIVARYAPFWLYYHQYFGTEAQAIRDLHLRYNSPIVRIAPFHLSVSNHNNDVNRFDPVNEIYVQHGGFKKPGYYDNFKIDGHATIFSSQDRDYRALRAKAVLPLFAINRVKESFEKDDSSCHRAVAKFIKRLRKHRCNASAAKESRKLDILDECRRLATDVLSGYLFDRCYGALEEDGLLSDTTGQHSASGKPPVHLKNTASPFVDSFVAVGCFFLLPQPIFNAIVNILDMFFPDKAVTESSDRVDGFCKELAESSIEGEQTYQACLLHKSNIDPTEVNAQMKDLIFAGTDTTGMNLGTLCFHLVKRQDWLIKLKDALAADNTPSGTNPILDATIKEGLRLGFGNPTRLPRLAPGAGSPVQILGYKIPPGTVVGCSSYVLQLDPKVFPEPFEFRPERWLQDSADTDIMNANMLPFGAGVRQCIARSLATQELLEAVKALVLSEVMEGLQTVNDTIEKFNWFNSRVKGDQGIELLL